MILYYEKQSNVRALVEQTPVLGYESTNYNEWVTRGLQFLILSSGKVLPEPHINRY
jgi:hypothetical protein